MAFFAKAEISINLDMQLKARSGLLVETQSKPVDLSK